MLISGSPADLLPEIPPYIWAGLAALIIAIAGCGLLAWRLITRRRINQPEDEPQNANKGADMLTRAAALIATIVAGQGMWQFLERIIGDVPWYLRALMFAFLEIAVVTSAVRAKRSMRESFSAGVDGIAVWVLTSASALLAALEARSLPEALFRLAAPLVAAWLWERGMAIERRRITGRSRIHWRLTPERVLVRIGLAEATDRTAGEVDAHRRITRIALAAKKVHQLSEAGASDRKLRRAIARRDRALDLAVEHTNLAQDTTKQTVLLDLVTTLGGADSLSEILAQATAPWSRLDHPALGGPAEEPAEMPQEAQEAIAAYKGWRPPKLLPFPITPPRTPAFHAVSGRVPALVSSNGKPVNGHAHTPPRTVADPATTLLPTLPVSESVSVGDPETWPLKDGDILIITDTGSASESEQSREYDDEERDERGRPNEQDNRRAEEWIRTRCRGRNGVGQRPTWNEVGKKFGFSDGWGGNRVKAVQERMTGQGYQFLDDGTVLVPNKSLTPEADLGEPEASAEDAAKTRLLDALGLPTDEPGPYPGDATSDDREASAARELLESLGLPADEPGPYA
ncbi:hypothetical protein IMZ11_02165 [Microtetraspora sp. AC03309]|uniref:hypothetical protein n=1 Tax=Microtetraspora sp. AC03309 TaxID=2779376 RepID=UPI001E295D1D|nr:hypothetical protein [Microtetraspora sp. AC03309]MCC5574445.1 hypothetical protein [Microtetraspora sp. AC03309]